MSHISDIILRNIVIHFRLQVPYSNCLLSETCNVNNIFQEQIYTPPQKIQHLIAKGKNKKVRKSKKIFKKTNAKRYNFYMIKDEIETKYSFIIFPRSKNIIISGIENYNKINHVLSLFAKNIGISTISNVKYKVVNSTYTGIITYEKHTSTFKLLKNRKKENENFTINFRSQFFPACKIKWNKLGTINIFNNGKYVIVGVKSEEQAQELREKLCALMKNC